MHVPNIPGTIGNGVEQDCLNWFFINVIEEKQAHPVGISAEDREVEGIAGLAQAQRQWFASSNRKFCHHCTWMSAASAVLRHGEQNSLLICCWARQWQQPICPFPQAESSRRK